MIDEQIIVIYGETIIAIGGEALDVTTIEGALKFVNEQVTHCADCPPSCQRLATMMLNSMEYWQSLPYEDLDQALKEIDYAFDTLKVDGFALVSNFGGIYISDDRLDKIWEELNRLCEVVFVHPGKPAGDNLPLFGRDISVYEYPFDTTRGMMDLIYKGKLQRYPNIRLIFAHAGGTIPYIAYHLSIAKEWGAITQNPEEVLSSLINSYYSGLWRNLFVYLGFINLYVILKVQLDISS